MEPFGVERAVVAMAGIDTGLVRQPVEQLGRHVPVQRREVLGAPEGVADASGKRQSPVKRYVVFYGVREPVRVGFSYLTDDDIRDLGRTYRRLCDAKDSRT
jgi:hypothetical protein